MDELNLEELIGLPVFDGIPQHNLAELLRCVYARRLEFSKGDRILTPEDYQQQICLVLSGQADILARGRPAIRLGRPEMFGRGFFQHELPHDPGGGGQPLEARLGRDVPLTAVAACGCTVLRFVYSHAIVTCWSSCFYHMRFADNVLRIAAAQNQTYL